MKPDLNVVLIGYRCSGKTTIGREVAARLGWPFVDTDEYVEAKAGRPIREIFAQKGEEYFRDLESGVILDVFRRTGQVVAVGGGAVMRPENVANIKRKGLVFLLWAEADEIRRRMAANRRAVEQRPALLGQDAISEVESVLAAREPMYRAAADHVLDTQDQEPKATVRRILAIIEQVTKRG